MSIVVTLLPGMPGYETHKLDYAVSNYNGAFEPKNLTLLITPRRKPKIVKEQP